MLLIHAGESTAARRRLYFDLRGTDGLTAATGEGSQQPQISVDGASWTNTGIAALTHIGNGRYYAALDGSIVASAGTRIESRYKSGSTMECRGDSAMIVAFDPNDSVRAGLTALPNVSVGSSGSVSLRGELYSSFDDLAVLFSRDSFVAEDGTTTTIVVPESSNLTIFLQTTSRAGFTRLSESPSFHRLTSYNSATRTATVTPAASPAFANGDIVIGHSWFSSEDPLAADPSVYASGTVGKAIGRIVDLYQALIKYTRDQSNATDEYTVLWHLNGAPLTSGITSPTIQVVKRLDGTNLVSSTSMSQIGSTAVYKLDVTTSQRLALGEAAIAITTAIIDGQTRTSRTLIGRDS